MAITTMSGLRAALPGQPKNFTKANLTSASNAYMSLWGVAGLPAAGSLSIGNTTTGDIPTKSTGGAFDFVNPSSGNSYLAKVIASCQNAGTLIIYDRLWHAGSFTSVNGTINATDSTPIDRGSTGEGAELWMEVNGATSGSSPTISATFTDQAGNTGNIANATLPVSSISARMYPFPTNSGIGIRSVENLAGNAAPTGTFNLVILRRLVEIPFSAAGGQVIMDWMDTAMPRIHNDACIAMMIQTATGGSGIIAGSISIAQG